MSALLIAIIGVLLTAILGYIAVVLKGNKKSMDDLEKPVLEMHVGIAKIQVWQEMHEASDELRNNRIDSGVLKLGDKIVEISIRQAEMAATLADIKKANGNH